MTTIRIIECGSIKQQDKGILGRLRKDRLPVNCFLIQNPNGTVLVDTGIDSSIVEKLQALGFTPNDIDVIVLTCLDADHTGGLKALTENASPRILCSDEELYWMQRNAFKKKQPQENIWGVEYERYFFKACMEEPLNYKFDVLGDESVQLYLCTGHTFGTTACVVTNKKTGDFVVLASDIILNAASFEEGEVFHQSQQEKVLKWLKNLAAMPNCKAVLPTHERYGINIIDF